MRWKNALETFKAHSESEYHKTAVLDADNFVQAVQRESVKERMDSAARVQRQTNPMNLMSNIEVVLFCGRQGIALRGHRDAGPLTLEDPLENDGNFCVLVRLKIRSEDDLLTDHLETAPGNATYYLSPQIQNEILVASSTLVQQTIVSRVNSAKCFSLLADETTDISGTEQMSVCVRYLLNDKLHEDFLAFVEVTNLTWSGQGLASTLMALLRDKGVDATYLCGQGYDGAANMSGRLNGVQAVIQREHPAALYMHCASHSLNLALCGSCNVPEMRNAFSVVQEVCAFLEGLHVGQQCSRKRSRSCTLKRRSGGF
ncbi:unnamed protein product [Ixodes hexagonus]